jgi:hypothetical protein
MSGPLAFHPRRSAVLTAPANAHPGRPPPFGCPDVEGLEDAATNRVVSIERPRLPSFGPHLDRIFVPPHLDESVYTFVD